jgi:protein-disulfide isomerase/uncharacterized membrane protein
MKKKLKIAFIVILFIGLTISTYLFYRQISLISNSLNEVTSICQVLSLGNCDDALKSDDLIFSLPWTAWGFLYFLFFLIMAALSSFLKENFKYEANILSLSMSIAGIIVSTILLSSIALGKSPFCVMCIIVHILNFALIYCLWSSSDIKLKQVILSIKSVFYYLFLGKSENPSVYRTKTVIILMVFFLFIALYQRLSFEVSIQSYYAQFNRISDNTSDNFLAIKPIHIPVGNFDASIGPENAPVQLIVFSDFECPYCAEFAMECKKWIQEYPNKIRLSFKNYPLSSVCNPMMENDMHPQACKASMAAQAALLQNKFWIAHDLLFEKGIGDDGFKMLVEQCNLDPTKFYQDIQSKEVEQKIQDDINLANQLGISGTPSVFLNKRKIENLNPEMIKNLIEKILLNK